MTLYIRLLGAAEISHENMPIHLPGYKPLALLAYLLMTGKAHTRSHLVDLFYDNSHDPRASLRWTLHQLNKRIGTEYVQANRQQISFKFSSDFWLDVRSFEGGQSEMYRGDLLEGVFVQDAGGFIDWLLFERERLRDIYQTALIRQLETCENNEDCHGVVQIAYRLIGLDNLREEWHRAMMRAYARQGKRKAALAQFARCRQLLQNELGIDPMGETQQLYKDICAGNSGAWAWKNRKMEKVGVAEQTSL